MSRDHIGWSWWLFLRSVFSVSSGLLGVLLEADGLVEDEVVGLRVLVDAEESDALKLELGLGQGAEDGHVGEGRRDDLERVRVDVVEETARPGALLHDEVVERKMSLLNESRTSGFLLLKRGA